MTWLELRVHTDRAQAAQVENCLLESGAEAITYTDAGDQPILEPDVGEMPRWPDIVLVALFDSSINTEEKTAQFEQLCSDSTPTYCWNIVEDRVWEREWLQYHKPVKFGDAFWVFHEPVEAAPTETELPTLLLDPGLAFGTGSHATTALCLEWIALQNWPGKQLIDYGCGSGILAIAASILGCSYVQSVDIDPQALIASRENAMRNHLDNKIEFFLAHQEPYLQADIVVANILAGPLIELAPLLANKLVSGGQICLSGILDEQKTDIVATYDQWFSDITITELDGWVRITGCKKAIR